MGSIEHLPLPYFEIDQNYQIQFTSNEAKETFLPASDLVSLVEETDRDKLLKLVKPDRPKMRIEANMKTKAAPFSMFELLVQWEGNLAQILCYPLENRIHHLMSKMQDLRNRLSETDFSLLEKKEELEQAIHQINQLSGTFISLNVSTGFVPLFGNLESQKVKAFGEEMLKAVENGQYSHVLFDFTAVTQFSQEGLTAIQNIFQTLNLMGQEVVIVGITPEQALKMNQHQWILNSNYLSSLSEALRLFL